jgi:hypothetical protein
MAWQGKTLTGAQVQMRPRHLAHNDASRFLPDLTRVKSGRACLPLGRRVPRPHRQARPDLPAVSQDYPPLPCGLRLRATDRATLHRSVTLSVRVPSSERDEKGYEVSPHPGSVLDIAGTMKPTCPQVFPFNHAVSSADDVGKGSNIAGGKRRTAAQRQSSEKRRAYPIGYTPCVYFVGSAPSGSADFKHPGVSETLFTLYARLMRKETAVGGKFTQRLKITRPK